MSMHRVEFNYNLPESGVMEFDLDPALDPAEKEEIALQEIKDSYVDVTDIEIVNLKEID